MCDSNYALNAWNFTSIKKFSVQDFLYLKQQLQFLVLLVSFSILQKHCHISCQMSSLFVGTNLLQVFVIFMFKVNFKITRM